MQDVDTQGMPCVQHVRKLARAIGRVIVDDQYLGSARVGARAEDRLDDSLQVRCLVVRWEQDKNPQHATALASFVRCRQRRRRHCLDLLPSKLSNARGRCPIPVHEG